MELIDKINDLKKKALELSFKYNDDELSAFREKIEAFGSDFLHVVETNEKKVDELVDIKKKLEKTKEKYKNLYDYAPVAYFTFNSDGIVVALNKTGAELLGASIQEIVGVNFFEYLSPEYIPGFKKHLIEAVSHKIKISEIFKVNVKSGKTLRLLAETQAISEDKFAETYVHIAFKDVTELEISKEIIEEKDKLFQALFDQAGDANYLLYGEVYINCNPKALALFGLDSLKEIVGKSPADFSPEFQEDGVDSKAKARHYIDMAYEHGHSQFEWIHTRNNDNNFYCDVTLTSINKAGKNYIHVTLRDIDEKKRAQKQVALSESNLDSIMQNSPNAVAMCNATGELLHYNSKFYDFILDKFKKTIELGSNFSQYLTGQELKEWHYSKREALHGKNFHIEKKVTINQKDEYYDISFNPVFLDNAVQGFSVFIRDITTYKESEKILKNRNEDLEKLVMERSGDVKEQADFLQVLLNTIPAPVFYKDADGRYLDMNESFAGFFGVEKANVVNKTAFDIWPKHLADTYHGADLKVFSGGDNLVVETKVHDSKKRERDVFIHKSSYRIKQGEKKGIVGIVFDVTESKRLEDNLRRTKDTMTAMFNAIQETALLVDKSGSIVMGNETASQRLNLNPNELVGKNIFRILDLEVSHTRKVFFDRVFETGQPQYFEDSRDDLYISNSFYPVFDASGIVYQVAIISVDITKRKIIEDKLKKEQELISTLIDSVPDLIYIKDETGKYINCNKAFCQFRDKSKNEIVGRTDFELLPHDEAVEFSGLDDVMFDIGKPIRSDQTLVFPNGETYVFDTIKTPLYDNMSNIRGLVGVSRDVSEFKKMQDDISKINRDLEEIIDKRTVKLQEEIHERIKAEDALKKSREMYRNLFNDVSVGIYRISPDGTVLLANPAMISTLGYTSLNELKHRNLLKDGFADLDSREIFIREVVLGGESLEYESVWLKKDNSQLNVFEKAKAVKDSSGNIIYIEGAIEDVTARRRADKLQQSVYKISEAAYYVQNVDELYNFIHNIVNELLPAENFYISIYNPEKNEITFPYFVDELESPEVSKLGPYPFSLGLTEYVLKGGKSQFFNMQDIADLEERGLVKVNGPTPYHWIGAPLKTTENKTIGVIAVQAYDKKTKFDKETKDILGFVSTQIAMVINRKQIEEDLSLERKYLSERVVERTEELSALNAELERAVRTKDEFLANMSHELRTPLNAILGLSEIMLKQKIVAEHERMKKSLGTIRDSGAHLLNLINDILDLSKIEAGKLDLNIDKLDVAAICNTGVQFVKQAALKKAIHIDIDIDPLVPMEFWADSVRVKQILINLLNNAVKFTAESGKVGLLVKTDRQNTTIYFTVWDTGIGIASDNLSRLFKPFVQVSGSLAREYEGTGLGLSLVSKLTEMHGGGVTVESEEGAGSRFTIALPIRNPFAISNSPNFADLDRSVIAGVKKAFIVEDSHEDAKILCEYLGNLDIKTQMFDFDTNITETIIDDQPDVIFLDILLWDKSGWDLLSELKRNDKLSHIPVIVVTILQERTRAFALGADGYLAKPLMIRSLYDNLVKAQQKINRSVINEQNSVGDAANMDRLPLILLAEDNEANLQTLETFLEYGGCRVVVARNGKEAYDSAAEYKPDLILMDIQMPKMDGLESIRLIKQHSRIKETPIIALTALAMPGDKERCLSAGANDYISKPVNFDTLIDAMTRLLPDGKKPVVMDM